MEALPHTPHARLNINNRLCALQTLLLILAIFIVDEDKAHHHNRRADPVQPRRVLGIEHHLADQTQRDRQTQADRDDKRAGEQHGICPAKVAHQARRAVHKHDGEDFVGGRELEGFDARDVQHDQARPEEQDVAQPDQAEE